MTTLIQEDKATRQVIIDLVADDLMDSIGDLFLADAQEMIDDDPEFDQSDLDGLAYTLAEEMAVSRLTR